MNPFFFFVLGFIAFLSGILVKLTDFFSDRRNPAAYPLALLYGSCIGYLISQSPFSMLFLAALFAQALAGKIDHPAHALGLVTAFLAAFYLGFPSTQPLLFFFFLMLAYADELSLRGFWKPFGDYRLFLKLGALGTAFLGGGWEFFAGILLFDGGYLLADLGSQHL